MATKRRRNRGSRKVHHAETKQDMGSNKPGTAQTTPPPYFRWIIIIALAGMLLSAYLTVLTWLRVAPLACGEGSSCEVVQSSTWGSIFGIPVSFFGVLFYTAVGWAAWRIPVLERRWRWVWRLTLPAFAVSLYLTAVSLFVIKAACLYCLGSNVLVTAIFVLAILSRPKQLLLKPWLKHSIAGFVAVLVGIQLVYTLPYFTKKQEDPYLQGLAQHLRKHAVMYGASWCSACAEQKSYFKGSVKRLPYIECSPQGPRGPQAPICVTQGIRSYPTWVIKGQRYVSVLKPRELARLTGYPSAP